MHVAPLGQGENLHQDPEPFAPRKCVKFFQGVSQKDAWICIRCRARYTRLAEIMSTAEVRQANSHVTVMTLPVRDDVEDITTSFICHI